MVGWEYTLADAQVQRKSQQMVLVKTVDVATITQQLNSLPPHKQKEILVLLDELSDARGRTGAQNEFLLFVRKMWPAFI